MDGSNSVSIAILDLDATAENESTFTRDLSLKKTSKGNVLKLQCGHSLGVHHLCMP